MKPCTPTCHDLGICHSSCPCLFVCSEVALRTHCEDTMGLRPNDRTCGMLHNDYGSSPCPRICVRLLVCFFDLRCVIPRGPNNLWPIKASVSGQPATNQMAADCKMKCSAKSNALNIRKSHIKNIQIYVRPGPVEKVACETPWGNLTVDDWPGSASCLNIVD